MAGAIAIAGLAAGASPAAAEPQGELLGSKVTADGQLDIFFAASDGTTSVPLDPKTVTVQLQSGGATQIVDKPKVSSADAADETTRAAMLVLDTSGSMEEDGKLDAAKTAALSFLDTVPKNVRVGLVTFADPATVLSPPTSDLAGIRTKIRALKADGDTAMFEAVQKATQQLRGVTSGSILLLTDGKNEDTVAPVSRHGTQARKALNDQKIQIAGVVVGNQARADVLELMPEDRIIPNSGGSLEKRLSQAFTERSKALNDQLLVSVPLPEKFAQTGSYTVTGLAGGVQVTGMSVYSAKPAPPKAAADPKPQVVVADRRLTAVTTPVAVAALLALFGALVIFVGAATGAMARSKDEDSEVVRRLALYTFSGRETRRLAVAEQTTALGNSAMARGAVELAERLARNRNLERTLDGRLDAAGLPLRTAEWTVLHIGAAVGGALLFLLIGAGSVFAGLLGLILGLVGPWLFLTLRQSRRESAFLGQLPDTLQLLAGSLSAGYSLPQAMDTVVREAKPPIGTEFNRALVEARLGVPPEDALEGIATRTRSRDFSWIVMAIRIQREVGGNLAELLTTVAETLRERERLRRHVSALSAEGRLSGVILAALPLVFTIYLMFAQPDYLRPMYTTPLGVLMLITGGVLLAIGGFFMSRVVKVKV
jgi:tight adherence protein B